MKIVTVDSNNKQTKEASREMERRCDVLQIDLQKLSQKHSELKISYEELEVSFIPSFTLSLSSLIFQFSESLSTKLFTTSSFPTSGSCTTTSTHEQLLSN
jgi:hypothetical protein